MSQWTYVHGIVKVESVKPLGITTGFGLPKGKRGWKKYLKSWFDKGQSHILIRNGHAEVLIDYGPAVETIIDEVLPRPTGSEGPVELAFAPAKKHQEWWGHDGVYSGSCMLNLDTYETDALNPRAFERMHEKDVEKKLVPGWYHTMNDNFAIAVYGNLRNMSTEQFITGFKQTLKEIHKYFNLEYIDISVRDSWSASEARMTLHEETGEVIIEYLVKESDAE
jgi:hypothetical protein